MSKIPGSNVIAEPKEIQTKKFETQQDGFRVIINRSKYDTEGKGALDVINPDTSMYTSIPNIRHVTRATKPGFMSAHYDGIVTNQVTYDARAQNKMVTRPTKNSLRDGLVVTTLKSQDMVKERTGRENTRRYQRTVDDRGMLTEKNSNTNYARQPLPRMVNNLHRY